MPDVYFEYGPVTTRVTAGYDVYVLLNSLLTIPNPENTDEQFSFWNGMDHTLLSGHLHFAIAALNAAGVSYEVFNAPQMGVLPNPDPAILATGQQPKFRLKTFQCSTVRKMVNLMRGNVQLGTGGGKTASYLAALRYLELWFQRNIRSITVVTVKNLAKQMVERMNKSGLTASVFGDSGWQKANNVVGVVNGLVNAARKSEPAVTDLLSSSDVICFDESHHTQAQMCYEIALRSQAKYRWGLSATVYANKENPYAHPSDMKIMGVLGPIIVNIPAKFLWENGHVAKPDICFIPVTLPNAFKSYGKRIAGHWQDMSVWRGVNQDGDQTGVEWDLIVNNDYRNGFIQRLAYWRLVTQADSKIVILVQRLDHGKVLQRWLARVGIYSVCCYGGQKVVGIDQYGNQREFKDTDDQVLADFESGKQRVLIGSQKFDEGQSFPMFTDLILAQAGKGGEANRRVFQRVGRGLHSGCPVKVWDFMDQTHWMPKRQSEARISALHDEGYPVRIDYPPESLWPIPGA